MTMDLGSSQITVHHILPTYLENSDIYFWCLQVPSPFTKRRIWIFHCNIQLYALLQITIFSPIYCTPNLHFPYEKWFCHPAQRFLVTCEQRSLDWIASIIPQQWRNLPWRAPSNGGWNNLGWVFYSRKQSFVIHMQDLLPVYIICNWYPAMKWMLPGVTLVYKILLLLLLFVALFWASSFHMTQLVSEILTSISSVYAGDAVQLPGTTIFMIGVPFHYSVKDKGHGWVRWSRMLPFFQNPQPWLKEMGLCSTYCGPLSCKKLEPGSFYMMQSMLKCFHLPLEENMKKLMNVGLLLGSATHAGDCTSCALAKASKAVW